MDRRLPDGDVGDVAECGVVDAEDAEDGNLGSLQSAGGEGHRHGEAWGAYDTRYTFSLLRSLDIAPLIRVRTNTDGCATHMLWARDTHKPLHDSPCEPGLPGRGNGP